MKTLFSHAAGLAAQPAAASSIPFTGASTGNQNANAMVEASPRLANLNSLPDSNADTGLIAKDMGSLNPSQLSLFITSLVFLKDGASRDWQPVISSPCYNYL